MPGVSQRTGPVAHLRTITPGASVLSPRPRDVYIDTTGTIAIENQDGTTIAALNVVRGDRLGWSPYKITAATSAVVIGMYD